ncbi:MAG TPA: RNase adapter RapZ [Sedimenticola thiotaurini]|uniref:RNase adapter RapZ n=1 Tax=Sedimenticola thiotaurini TaxID=1543721 RepID=A0A831RNK3_9GAMM|nr:RNase adapter RapZ [Sedimenticola thiotaurini]
MKLVIVTGLSGSGKTTALNTLEDLGHYCIDNLPLLLLEPFGRILLDSGDQRFEQAAIGIDARNHGTELEGLKSVLDTLRQRGVDVEILYLEAADETLIKRYSETRRRHPLSDDRHPLIEAIQLERAILGPFLNAADLRIDTTRMNVHQLRDLIRRRVGERPEGELSLLFESFGFKHGVPNDSDFVYDVRCLPNPYWRPDLRPLTGRDPAVAGFLENDPDVHRMHESISGFLEHWIPSFEADGRAYLTVSIGCTGGQHRSVYLVERLSRHFRERGHQVLVRHRELP